LRVRLPNGFIDLAGLYEPFAAVRTERGFKMAETPRLSVEKALQKLRESDAKADSASRASKIDALDEEIKRMRAQRLRLDRKPPKRD
jgi:hypothetical protein